MQNRNSGTTINGIGYFRQGWQLATLPGIRRYVIVPLLVNILFVGSAFSWLFFALNSGSRVYSGMFPAGCSGSIIYSGHWLSCRYC